MLESNFKLGERKKFEKLGWKFITTSAGGGVPTGFPDTLCLAPNGYPCYTEWKQSKTASRRALQDYWNKWLNDRGHDAFFVSPEGASEWRREVLKRSENYGKNIR